MSKCRVISLQGKIRAKHTEANITSFSAMLADGVADLLPEQRCARIYDFHRPEPGAALRIAGSVKNETETSAHHHASPWSDR